MRTGCLASQFVDGICQFDGLDKLSLKIEHGHTIHRRCHSLVNRQRLLFLIGWIVPTNVKSLKSGCVAYFLKVMHFLVTCTWVLRVT